MFEAAEEERPEKSSDRYGIMEKLKRLQEGADLDELLADLDDEFPESEEEEEEDEEDAYLTEVQKKVLFGSFWEALALLRDKHSVQINSNSLHIRFLSFPEQANRKTFQRRCQKSQKGRGDSTRIASFEKST